MPREKRSQLVVEPAIQYSLVRQMASHWGLHLLASAILLMLLQVLLGGIFQPLEYHVARVAPMVASQTIALLFLCPIFLLRSFRLSNRFVGPIHRLRDHLRQLADGQLHARLSFRSDDFWSEVAQELERAIAAVERNGRQSDGQTDPSQPPQNVRGPGITMTPDDLPTLGSAPASDSIT